MAAGTPSSPVEGQPELRKLMESRIRALQGTLNDEGEARLTDFLPNIGGSNAKHLQGQFQEFEKFRKPQASSVTQGPPGRAPQAPSAPPPPQLSPTGFLGSASGGPPPQGGAIEALQGFGAVGGGEPPPSQFQVGALSALRSTLGRRNPPISTRVLQGKVF